MRTTTFNRIASLGMLALLFSLALAAVYAATEPSDPTGLAVQYNTTSAYKNGSELNGTRGFIYTVELNESQPSQKWVGYVGNITGEFALQDGSGNALYDWDITTVAGEIYATKESAYINTFDETAPDAGGIPYWPNLTCASAGQLSTEEALFNHTSTEEDSYTSTFTSGAGFSNPGFFAGENEILDTDVFGGGNCAGAYLNLNNTDNTGNWTMVVLTDQTKQSKSAAEDTTYRFDIIYASLLNSNGWGFDSNQYDFQIMLPQSGLEGAQSNVAFYFYVELI